MTHGKHIKVLGKGNTSLLRDPKHIESLLLGLIDSLGMRALAEPHMYEVEEEIQKLGVQPFEDEGGVTGVAVLSTSHCAIHTWPLRNFFVMDIYSCRDFDPAPVQELLNRKLGASDLKITDISHALEYEPTQTAKPKVDRKSQPIPTASI